MFSLSKESFIKICQRIIRDLNKARKPLGAEVHLNLSAVGKSVLRSQYLDIKTTKPRLNALNVYNYSEYEIKFYQNYPLKITDDSEIY